ncbi:conserved protein of unknown function [Ectopseudomonas oleovorans]|uniref:Uncharacterized protein n=1 Tax=Ectopseudomonas oleovorans TaxID=301 RepID=A0A653B8D9_ECTOL|nr:conserved protein of unknown function [Pseudomonas oleovorans]
MTTSNRMGAFKFPLVTNTVSLSTGSRNESVGSCDQALFLR